MAEPLTDAQRALRRDAREQLQRGFVEQLRRRGVPEPETEVCLVPGRKWRWDVVFPAPVSIAIEVQGGTWTGGGHSRGKGQRRDAEKANAATLAGWRTMFVTSDMIEDQSAADVIAAAVIAALGGQTA